MSKFAKVMFGIFVALVALILAAVVYEDISQAKLDRIVDYWKSETAKAKALRLPYRDFLKKVRDRVGDSYPPANDNKAVLIDRDRMNFLVSDAEIVVTLKVNREGLIIDGKVEIQGSSL